MRTRNMAAALLLSMCFGGIAHAGSYDALATAIKAGDVAQVTALLAGGLSPSVAGKEKQSAPLVLAVATKNHAIAKLLLDKGANPDARHATYYNATALMLAVNNRDVEMAKLLLAAGAKVNLTDKAGDSALNWATFHGDAALAELLLSHQIDATLFGHGNALDVAMRRGHQPLVERYVDYLGRRQPVAPADQAMFRAVAAGDVRALKGAIAAGANVHASDSTGRSALAMAARKGDVWMAEALLDAGARVDAQDPIGFTALHEAVRDGKQDIVALLVLRKADVRVRAGANGLALTPLHLAAAGGNVSVVGMLLKNGADLNARDTESATPLLWATNQSPDMAVILVRIGADPDIASTEGDSPRTIAEKRKITALLDAIAAMTKPAKQS